MSNPATDLPDWANQVSSDARVVAQATPNADTWTGLVPIASTDQTLLVVILESGDNTTNLTIFGSGSDIGFFSGYVNVADNQALVIVPITGALDTEVSVDISASGTIENVYIFASSDWSWTGAETNPTYIQNLTDTAVHTTSVGAGGAGGSTFVLNNSNAQIASTPSTTERLVIDLITLAGQTVAGIFSVHLNSSAGTANVYVNVGATDTADPIIRGPIYGINGQGMWAAWSGAGPIQVTVAWHYEDLAN